ncbi:MAG: oligosaccharide flippase family protein [Rubrivivax sp.]|nr:oligosaccharide flippase family protein [Rubrivivax sp.]
MSDSTSRSLRDKVVKSALWLIVTRWSHRLVGLASTMVLARVLMPEDFGVVAAVMAVVAVLDGFFEFGFDLALIRAKDARREDYDTVWTMRILKGVVFGLLVMAVSPFVAGYAGTGQLVPISIAIGVGLMIRGADNIGIVRFEKEMQYDKLFAVRLYPRLAGAAATIVLALVLRSYWAIVLGTALQNLFQTAFSYWLCDYRPRWRLQGAGAVWHYSKWILVSSISRKLYSAMDRFLLSGWVSSRELGFYSVSSSLASLITNELIGAVGNALIPGYSKLQDQTGRLRAAFLMSQAAFVALVLPTAVGTIMLARPITEVVLGPSWLDSSWMLAAFAAFFLGYSIVENLNRFMAITGLQVKAALSGMVRSVIFLALVYPAFQWGGMPMLIGMKIVLSAVEILYLSWKCCTRIEVPLVRYLSGYWRPLLATGCMAAVLWALDRHLQAHALVQLFAGAVAGTAVYIATLMLVWHISGRPAGLETLLRDLAARKLFAGSRKV